MPGPDGRVWGLVHGWTIVRCGAANRPGEIASTCAGWEPTQPRHVAEGRGPIRDGGSIVKKIINPAEGTITFKFDIPADATDEARAALAPITFDPAKAAPNNRAYAELHGWSARIGDAAALSRNAENGHKVTEAMRRAEVAAMVEHYEGGSTDWNVRGPGAGKKAAPLNPIILAISQKMGCSYEEAQAKVAAQFLAELDK